MFLCLLSGEHIKNFATGLVLQYESCPSGLPEVFQDVFGNFLDFHQIGAVKAPGGGVVYQQEPGVSHVVDIPGDRTDIEVQLLSQLLHGHGGVPHDPKHFQAGWIHH